MRAPSTSKNPKMRVTLLLLCNITSICCLKKRLGSLHFKIYEIINTLVYSGAYKRQTKKRKEKNPDPFYYSLSAWVYVIGRKSWHL